MNYSESLPALPLQRGMIATLLAMALILAPFFTILAQGNLSTAASLPEAGDVYHVEVDRAPQAYAGDGGANRRWDLSNLLSPVTQRVQWQGVGNLLRVQWDEQTEALFTRDKSELTWLGGSGPDFLGHSRHAQWLFTDPLLERKTGLRYGSGFFDEATCLVTFSKFQADPVFLKAFPLQPDSIRIRYTIERQAILDAFGKVVLPGEISEVLREKRTDRYIPVRVETKIGRRSWQTVNLPLKTIIKVSYHFHQPESREPVLSLHMAEDNSGRTERISFRSPLPERNIFPLGQVKPNAYPAPNPTLGAVRFDFISLPPGNYRLVIWNQLGGEQWRKAYAIKDRYAMDKVDLSALKHGYYWYELSDAHGNKYKPQPLIIIRP